MTRTSTVTLAAALQNLANEIDTDDGCALIALAEASQRLLELRRLAAEALPSVELLGDGETLKKLKLELGL